MFDKFEERCKLGWKSAYAMLHYKSNQSWERYRRYVHSMPKPLICQDCGGAGGEKEVILDDGTGPWYECGWCRGTGYVTPWDRGMWLTYKKMEKREWKKTQNEESKSQKKKQRS